MGKNRFTGIPLAYGGTPVPFCIDVYKGSTGTVLLVGALSFMPAVVLGPIADHLSAAAVSP